MENQATENEAPQTAQTVAPKLELRATVSNIIKFEKNTGKSLISAFSDGQISFTVLVELIQNLSVNPLSLDDIDAIVKAEGFEKISNTLEKALIDSGFLPKEEAKTKASTPTA